MPVVMTSWYHHLREEKERVRKQRIEQQYAQELEAPKGPSAERRYSALAVALRRGSQSHLGRDLAAATAAAAAAGGDGSLKPSGDEALMPPAASATNPRRGSVNLAKFSHTTASARQPPGLLRIALGPQPLMNESQQAAPSAAPGGGVLPPGAYNVRRNSAMAAVEGYTPGEEDKEVATCTSQKLAPPSSSAGPSGREILEPVEILRRGKGTRRQTRRKRYQAIQGDPSRPATSHGTWEEAKAPDGQVYYFNRRTGEASWTRPTAAAEGSGDSELDRAKGAAACACRRDAADRGGGEGSERAAAKLGDGARGPSSSLAAGCLQQQLEAEVTRVRRDCDGRGREACAYFSRAG